MDRRRADDLLRADLYATGFPASVHRRNYSLTRPAVDGADGTQSILGRGGFLSGCRYLLHDRDAKFCTTFDKATATTSRSGRWGKSDLDNRGTPGAALTVMEAFQFLPTNWMPRDVTADLIFEHPELVRAFGFPIPTVGLN